MDNHLDILNNLQRVPAPDYLLDKIEFKLKERSLDPQSQFWLRIAAAFLIGTLVFEGVFLTSQQIKSTEMVLNEVIANNSNHLYND